MKNLSFRAKLFLSSFILMIIIFWLFRHQFAIFPFVFLALSFVIFLYLVIFLKIFDVIETNSSLKYWEIRQDDDTHGTIKKICNFICSFSSLFYSNFLISIISIFFLYKSDFLSNKDPSDPSYASLLIIVSVTIVILIRILTYLNRKIAGEIGKGFRYATLPIGFTLFLWDFLNPLTKQEPPQFIFYSLIKNNILTIIVLGFALIAITSLDPLYDEIYKYYKNIKNK